MTEYDLATDRQPQAGSTHHAFGSEKRLKDVRKILRRNSGSGVGNDDFYYARCP
jgi:hypothetical protein